MNENDQGKNNIKKFLEDNEHNNKTMKPKQWDTAEAVLVGMVITINSYTKEVMLSNKQSNGSPQIPRIPKATQIQKELKE